MLELGDIVCDKHRNFLHHHEPTPNFLNIVQNIYIITLYSDMVGCNRQYCTYRTIDQPSFCVNVVTEHDSCTNCKRQSGLKPSCHVTVSIHLVQMPNDLFGNISSASCFVNFVNAIKLMHLRHNCFEHFSIEAFLFGKRQTGVLPDC